jgi:hypothetical protein
MSESKKLQFLCDLNVKAMTKRIYNAHQREGGSRPLAYFCEHVAGLMQGWPRLEYIDTYESLVSDPETEMDQINQDFYREMIEQFLPAGGFARVKKLETVDDYLNFDIQRDPPPVVNASVYRDGNRIPVNRKPIIRHYENDGVHGQSLGRKNKEMPGMDELWEAVNRPYEKIDRNDVPYYGQREDEGTTALMNTAWN